MNHKCDECGKTYTNVISQCAGGCSGRFVMCYVHANKAAWELVDEFILWAEGVRKEMPNVT